MVKIALITLLLSISSYAGQPIKVMIIDTGIDATNSNLTPYLDQADLKTHELDYKDTHKAGHGTHIAGIIVKGVCSDVKLYSCGYYSETAKGNENMEMEVACFKRAKSMGINLINYSGGGVTPNGEEFYAVRDLVKAGVYIIVAAGNREREMLSYKDPIKVTRVTYDQLLKYSIFLSCKTVTYYLAHSDECDANKVEFKKEEAEAIRDNYYPAGYKFDFVIPIGSKNNENEVSDFSNIGDVEWENGEDVDSVLPGNKHGDMSGTSQATAVRTNKILKGVCGLRGYK